MCVYLLRYTCTDRTGNIGEGCPDLGDKLWNIINETGSMVSMFWAPQKQGSWIKIACPNNLQGSHDNDWYRLMINLFCVCFFFLWVLPTSERLNWFWSSIWDDDSNRLPILFILVWFFGWLNYQPAGSRGFVSPMFRHQGTGSGRWRCQRGRDDLDTQEQSRRLVSEDGTFHICTRARGMGQSIS